MIDIENMIELVHQYETAENVNKKKEIMHKLVTNFKKCEKDINDRYNNLLKKEREINEK